MQRVLQPPPAWNGRASLLLDGNFRTGGVWKRAEPLAAPLVSSAALPALYPGCLVSLIASRPSAVGARNKL